jgi:sensor histidine kinase YesM
VNGIDLSKTRERERERKTEREENIGKRNVIERFKIQFGGTMPSV